MKRDLVYNLKHFRERGGGAREVEINNILGNYMRLQRLYKIKLILYSMTAQSVRSVQKI